MTINFWYSTQQALFKDRTSALFFEFLFRKLFLGQVTPPRSDGASSLKASNLILGVS